jgi:hypothetical protein
MFRKVVVAGLVAAVTFAAAVVAEARTISRSMVQGRMAPVAQSGVEHGAFRMKVINRGNGAHAERIEATARRLNVSGATAQNPPSFHVFLVKSDGSGAADFGAMRVNRRGNAGFIFDTRRASNSLPSGVNTIVDYAGGTIEVRDGGGTAVCAGTIPEFNVVVGDGQSRLQAVSSSVTGAGQIDVHRLATPNTTRERLTIACRRLASNTSYTAVAIAADTTETTIGTFTTNGRGFGGLRLADSSIPGGGVMGLAGLTVEIRDASGAVLTGTFPTIPQ